jgi:transcriptional regulator with XRE-family HTH domain
MEKSHLGINDIPDFLTKLIESEDISFSELARRVGATQGAFSHWKQRDGVGSVPGLDRLGLIAEFLEIELWALILIIQYGMPIPKKDNTATIKALAKATPKDLEEMLLALGDDDETISKVQIALAQLSLKSSQSKIKKR